jgi:DNA polymerase V
MDTVIALVDCQNFYCACERLFRPDLQDRPVAVLSNNDGCVIARSDAVKRMGVPMGAPHFKVRRQLAAAGVTVFSSNYALYADLSWRVMTVLQQEAQALEAYSIDEAFLAVPALERNALIDWAHQARRRVRMITGIPVRIGLGRTKTLAKAASQIAKQQGTPVCCLADHPRHDRALASVAVGDVWGIGPRYEQRLVRRGVDTARALRDVPVPWARRQMTVRGARTVQELRGHRCIELATVPAPRKSVIRSRSFGQAIHAQKAVREAVATHASRAAEKLRAAGRVAGHLQVFVHAGPSAKTLTYRNAASTSLAPLTHHTPTLLRAARSCLDRIWRDGPAYRKAGVMLAGLRPEQPRQAHLFEDGATDEQTALMAAVDRINRTLGSNTIGWAASMVSKPERADWTMRRAHRSPRYTTRWDDLCTVQAYG